MVPPMDQRKNCIKSDISWIWFKMQLWGMQSIAHLSNSRPRGRNWPITSFYDVVSHMVGFCVLDRLTAMAKYCVALHFYFGKCPPFWNMEYPYFA